MLKNLVAALLRAFLKADVFIFLTGGTHNSLVEFMICATSSKFGLPCFGIDPALAFNQALSGDP
jgi:hypothetical protein